MENGDQDYRYDDGGGGSFGQYEENCAPPHPAAAPAGSKHRRIISAPPPAAPATDPFSADRMVLWRRHQRHRDPTDAATYHSYSEDDERLRSALPPDSAVGRRTADGRYRLERDRAYRHALRAGLLWQTLVGEHVRFPEHWWDGARTPPLDSGDDVYDDSDGGRTRWSYVSRHRVRGDAALNGLVRNRGSPGRLLLHVVVREAPSAAPARDVAIGCFHPNARGVRRSDRPSPEDEGVREIWTAIRRRGGGRGGGRRGSGDDGRGGGVSMSLVDNALTMGRRVEEVGRPSPIGEKHTVTNENVRALFGEKPPVETVFIVARDLYRLITEAVEDERDRGSATGTHSPTRVLLREFVFGQR